MPSCLFGRSEAEKAELRELLESSNSQREEYRKAAEGASRRAEHLGKQLEGRMLELQELSGHYQALQQREARLLRENEALQQDTGCLKQSLSHAAAQEAELARRLAGEAAARKQAEADLRKLHKEREYLKMRVDRMQHALSILENVMDDTLRVSQSANEAAGQRLPPAAASSPAAALRQSMDAASVQQLQDLIRASTKQGGHDVHALQGDQLPMGF